MYWFRDTKIGVWVRGNLTRRTANSHLGKFIILLLRFVKNTMRSVELRHSTSNFSKIVLCMRTECLNTRYPLSNLLSLWIVGFIQRIKKRLPLNHRDRQKGNFQNPRQIKSSFQCIYIKSSVKCENNLWRNNRRFRARKGYISVNYMVCVRKPL